MSLLHKLPLPLFPRPLAACETKQEEEEEHLLPPEEPEHKKPIMQTKRIVVIGDGEDAALTAFIISRDPTIAHYQY